MALFLYRLIRFTLAAALLLLLVSASLWYYLNPRPAPQQVFINGTILTMDVRNPEADALLVERDRIVAVGPQELILKQIDPDARIIDLAGKTLLPGFIEAHGHFPGSGLDAIGADLNSPPMGSVSSVADALEMLQRHARTVADGDWVIGFGYDDTLVAEQRFLTRGELDGVSKRHPLLLMHVSGRISMVNSKALARLGIRRGTPSPEGGEIVRDDTGQATGVLKGVSHSRAMSKAFRLSSGQVLKLLQNAVEDYTVQGVTTVQSSPTTTDFYKPLTLLAGLGLIPQRLVVQPDLELAGELYRGRLQPVRNDKVVTGAINISTDGSIPGYTGFLSLPYFRPARGYNASYRGYSTLSQERLDAEVSQWHARGWQLALQASGDAAIDMAIKALARAQEAYPRQDSRPVIVYSQMARADQLEAMARLGISPSFFPSHIYYWGDRYQRLFLGPFRADRVSPLQSADRQGIRYSIHGDSPVTPIAPFAMVEHAVTRTTRTGSVLGPEERIDVSRALRAMTIDAAWQMTLENDRGSIEPGKLADLIVVSHNPLTVAVSKLSDIAVEQVWIGGVLRYNRNELGALP